MPSLNHSPELSNLSKQSHVLPPASFLKTKFIALTSLLLAASSAKAIDLDGDGMSDVWQRHYNIASGDRLGDPDGDGYANWREDGFGTNPNSALSRPDLKFKRIPEGLSILVPTVAGVDFQILMSTDLQTWVACQPAEYPSGVIEGTGSEIEFLLPSMDRAFFRTQTTVRQDMDQDNLNSFEEALLGLQDYNPDTDGDELNDGWEVAYGLPPTVFNDINVDEDGDGYNLKEESEFNSSPYSADFDADGLDDKAEALYGLNPNKKDSDGDGIFDGAEFRWDIFSGKRRTNDSIEIARYTLPDTYEIHTQYSDFFNVIASEYIRRNYTQANFLDYTAIELAELKAPSSKAKDVYLGDYFASDHKNPFRYALECTKSKSYPYEDTVNQVNAEGSTADLRSIYPLFGSVASGKLSIVTVGRVHTGLNLEAFNVSPTKTVYEYVSEYVQPVASSMPSLLMDGAIWESRNPNVYQYEGTRPHPNLTLPDAYGTMFGEFLAVSVTDARVFKNGQQVNTVTPLRHGETNLIFKAGSTEGLQISAKHIVNDDLWQHFTWSFDGLTGSATKTADGSSATVSIPSLDTAHTITLKLFDKVLWEWNVYPCEIIGKDAQDNFAETKNELKITKMQNSLDANNILIVDSDNDAVIIRIIGGARMESFTGKIGTLSAEGIVLDDLTAVTFVPSGQDLLTQGLILVQDVADDLYSDNGVGADNQSGDRSHQAQLGGEFLFTSSEEGEKEFSRWPVPIKKEMTVIVKVLRKNGIDVVPDNLGVQTISAMNVFSQIGIKLNFDVQFFDLPEGVDLTNGLEGASNDPKIPSREQEILIETLGTTSTNDLTVFYVPNFTDDNVKGEAIYPLVFNTIQTRYQNNVFMSENAHRIYTLAHEIGHVLTNRGHFGIEDEDTVSYEPENNVMTPQLGQVNGIDGSKRLTKEQEEMILNNNYFNYED